MATPHSAIAAFVVFLATPVIGQSTLEQNRLLCGGNTSTADVRIGACTAVIQSGKFSTTDLAIANANRGLAYLDKNDFAKAREDFEQALRLDPRCAVAYRGRGILFGKTKDFDRALADQARAIDIDPSPESYYARGVTDLDMSNNADAVASLTRAIGGRANYVQAYFLRGLAYLRLGDHPNAIADNTRVIALDSTYTEAYFNRGLAWVRSKDLDKALADFTSYTKLTPNDFAGWFQRGSVRYQKDDMAGALADFNQALTLKPDNASALFARARVHLSERRYDAAAADFTRVLAIDPSGYGAEAHYNRALAYARGGDRSRAFADYETAAALDPHDVDAPSRLVEVGTALKRYDDAEKYLRILIERFPAALASERSQAFQIVRYHQLKRAWTRADELLTTYLKALPAPAGGSAPSAAATASSEEPLNRLRARTAAGLGRGASALDYLTQADARDTFILARADAAFAELWDSPAFEAVVDLKAQSARALAKADRLVQNSPAKLDAVVTRMDALRLAQQHQDAIAFGEQVLAGDVSKFTDRDDEEVWVYDEIALAARGLGDAARAELAYRTGIDRVGTTNGAVVNLLLNGGLFLDRIGRFRDALTWADRAEKVGVSGFGAMFANEIRAVAYWALSQRFDLDRVVSEMEKHVDDNPKAMLNVYMLLGRKDDAANLAARLLGDPARVDTMLLDLQIYEAGPAYPGPMPPSAQAIRDGWAALASHPAVAAALKNVGRITKVPTR